VVSNARLINPLLRKQINAARGGDRLRKAACRLGCDAADYSIYRADRICILREQGWGWPRIGCKFGISGTCARYAYMKQMRRRERLIGFEQTFTPETQFEEMEIKRGEP